MHDSCGVSFTPYSICKFSKRVSMSPRYSSNHPFTTDEALLKSIKRCYLYSFFAKVSTIKLLPILLAPSTSKALSLLFCFQSSSWLYILRLNIFTFTVFQEILHRKFTTFQEIFKAVFTTFQEIFVVDFTTFQGIFGEKRWFLWGWWVVGLNSCGAVYGIFCGGVGRWRLCRSKSRSLCPISGFSTHAAPTAPLPAAPISI